MSGFSFYHLVTIPSIGIPASLPKLFSRNTDIYDMQFGLCEVGTGEDEAEVSVGRDGAFRIAYSPKAGLSVKVCTSLDMIPKTTSE